MRRRRRVVNQDIDRLVDLGQSAPLDRMAEEGLVAIVVPRRIEFEGALAHELRLQLRLELGILRLHVDADAGQDAGQRLDIGLRVAGADPHGVQFHDLAGVVLVEMPGGVVGIVEIAQHRRMMQRGDEQIAELAERVGANGAVLIVADQDANVGLVLMHVEMVEPEPGHAFAQLVRRIERAQDAARRRLFAPIVHRLLIDLLRGLLLIGIGDLIGALAPGCRTPPRYRRETCERPASPRSAIARPSGKAALAAGCSCSASQRSVPTACRCAALEALMPQVRRSSRIMSCGANSAALAAVAPRIPAATASAAQPRASSGAAERKARYRPANGPAGRGGNFWGLSVPSNFAGRATFRSRNACAARFLPDNLAQRA